MKVKVLIVEDEVLVAEEIALDLKDYGFEVTGIAISGEECFDAINKNIPHVILMDINIKGNKNGIELSYEINDLHKIPIVYLTANTDSLTIKEALKTTPSALISKPYTKNDLFAALAIAFEKHNERILDTSELNIHDAFFVKISGLYSKVKITDINYIEADGSYCKVHTDNKSYIVSSNLKCFNKSLQNSLFIRIHRSYVINLEKVDAFNTMVVVVNGKSLPISKSHRVSVKKLLMEN